jgi:two-component system response regulator HupR/HoxA
MMARATVLLVDDEVRSLEALQRILNDDFEVLSARSAAEAEAFLEGEIVHAILCDQRMPDETGVSFLKRVRDRWPDPVRMIISGYSDSDDIIAGINEAGIYQYITKPWDPDGLLETVRGAVELFRLQQETQTASVEMKLAAPTVQRMVSEKKRLARKAFDFDRIIHAPDSPMRQVIELARKCAEFDISVLITGESGTGKELIARAIHYHSHRAQGAFVVENCGALPDQLLESELFGCKKGAFTGAYQDRIGLFEVANNGTIFLDEIGETSPAFQVKLLRVLQESEIRPLGASKIRKVDVRVVAATNKDLELEVDSGNFRRDLFYRLSAFPLHVPPLRDRPMDIPHLAYSVLKDVSRNFGKAVSGFSEGLLDQFRRYSWPGNVRELQNEIQRMVAICERDVLDESLLPPRMRGHAGASAHGAARSPDPVRLAKSASEGSGTLKDMVEVLEREAILGALQRHSGNISRIADELGLSRVGLRNKLQRYGIRKRNGNGMNGNGHHPS